MVEARAPGSKISTVALWRGAVGVSAVRKARSRARRRSPICHPCARLLALHGILTEASRRADPARCEKGHRCADCTVCSPPSSSPSSRRSGLDRVRRRQQLGHGAPAADQGHRRSPSTATTSRRTAARSTSRSASAIEFDVTADSPARSTCTPPPSRSSSTRRATETINGRPDPGPGPDHRRVAHARQGPVHPRGAVSRASLLPLLSPARPRRRPGPADLAHLAIAGAGLAVAVSFVVLALAWRKPRYDAATSGRPAPAWLSRRASTPRPGSVACSGSSACSRCLPGPDRGPRQGPPHQPDLRHLLRLDLGRHGGRLAAVRPGLEGDQPVPHDQRRLARVSGGDPDEGVLTYPERLGLWPAARRPVRLRLDGAGLPPQRRPGPGPAVVRGLPRG